MTQEKLSADTGLSQSLISRLERGSADAIFFDIVKLCASLNIGSENLFWRAQKLSSLYNTVPRREFDDHAAGYCIKETCKVCEVLPYGTKIFSTR